MITRIEVWKECLRLLEEHPDWCDVPADEVLHNSNLFPHPYGLCFLIEEFIIAGDPYSYTIPLEKYRTTEHCVFWFNSRQERIDALNKAIKEYETTT